MSENEGGTVLTGESATQEGKETKETQQQKNDQPMNINFGGSTGERTHTLNLNEDLGKLSKVDLDHRISVATRSKAYLDKNHPDSASIRSYVEKLYQARYREEDQAEKNLTHQEAALRRELLKKGERDERDWHDDELAEEMKEHEWTPEEYQAEQERVRNLKEMEMAHGRENTTAIIESAKEGLRRVGISKKEFEKIEDAGLGNDTTFIMAAAIVNQKLKEKGLSRVKIEEPKKQTYPRTKKEWLAYARKLLGEQPEEK